MPVRVYSKMSGVGIDRLDLKSVHSLMQPLVIAPVVNVSSLWDVCMATYAKPNWSGLGTSQLVTRSTRHIVKSCDELTVVFQGVVTS